MGYVIVLGGEIDYIYTYDDLAVLYWCVGTSFMERR